MWTALAPLDAHGKRPLPPGWVGPQQASNVGVQLHSFVKGITLAG